MENGNFLFSTVTGKMFTYGEYSERQKILAPCKVPDWMDKLSVDYTTKLDNEFIDHV
jgi:hypothetical protein